MTISHLNIILAPPISPSESGSNEVWPLIDESVVFPSDYIEFISLYGTGRIDDFIAIFNPFTTNQELNFFEQKNLVLTDFNYLKNEDPDYYRFKLYPESNGLLPIGVTDNGDYIFWVASNIEDSNSWKTAIIASRSSDVEFFNESLTSLLYNVLARKVKAESLPASFPSNNIKFNKL